MYNPAKPTVEPLLALCTLKYHQSYTLCYVATGIHKAFTAESTQGDDANITMTTETQRLGKIFSSV